MRAKILVKLIETAGGGVSSVSMQKFFLCFSLSLLFFFVDVDVAYLFNQSSISMNFAGALKLWLLPEK